MERMRFLAPLAVTLALTAAGGSGWHTFRNLGISVRFPAGWHATARQLTPVDYPIQVLAVASYPFPRDPRPNGCLPAGTLAEMPPRGALIVGIEYISAQRGGTIDRHAARVFPPRPAHFRLGSARRFECSGKSYRLLFQDAGRFFQVSVAFGPKARAHVRATVLRVLDSFRAKRR